MVGQKGDYLILAEKYDHLQTLGEIFINHLCHSERLGIKLTQDQTEQIAATYSVCSDLIDKHCADKSF